MIDMDMAKYAHIYRLYICTYLLYMAGPPAKFHLGKVECGALSAAQHLKRQVALSFWHREFQWALIVNKLLAKREKGGKNTQGSSSIGAYISPSYFYIFLATHAIFA